MNNIQNLPVESRPLYNPDFPGVNKGAIDMWVEMIETSKSAEIKPSDIRPPPETILEVRFVIWGAKDVKHMREGYSNVMVSTSLDCKEYGGPYDPYQPTDEHFNCKKNAEFNWRTVYPKIRPTRSCTVQIDCWHYQMLGNELIGTLTLDIKKYLERVAKDLDALEIGPTDLKLKPLSSDGGEGKEDQNDDDLGSVTLSMYVLTDIEAQSAAAGIGRNEPNERPILLTPTEGRDWGAYLETFGFPSFDFGLWKKFIPLFVAMFMFLAGMVAMRQVGLL